MRRPRLRETALNLSTAVVVAAAAATVIRERALPAWRERLRLDPGDPLPADLRFSRLADSARLGVVPGTSTLLLVFRSTCPACNRVAPAWRSVIRQAPGRVLAVALEPAATGRPYAESQLPGATPVRPLDREGFVDRFRIRVVPTTLLIDPTGRLRLRTEGTLDSVQVARILAQARAPGGRRRTAPGGSASAGGSAGRLESQNDGR